MDFRLEVANHGFSARPHPKAQVSVSFHPKINIRVLSRMSVLLKSAVIGCCTELANEN